MNPTSVVNVASVPHRSPFRYPGGKTWLVPYVRLWLRNMPSRPSEFSEPFAGGAIVGLSALFDGLCDRLTIVELDDDVASVWKTILNGSAEALADRIASFQISRESVEGALRQSPETLLDQAFLTILRNRVQRGGILAPGASLMRYGENGKGITSRWYPQTLIRRILAIGKRRNEIRFIHGDGIQHIRENRDREDVAFFMDPPYTVAGRRLYIHSDIDHEELFRVTSSVRGQFLMTYDHVQAIRDLADRFGFQTGIVAMKNTHHEVMNELLVGKNLDWLKLSDRSNPGNYSFLESF